MAGRWPVSRVVLIVTGARVLADSFHASEWAREVVRQTVDALPSRSRATSTVGTSTYKLPAAP